MPMLSYRQIRQTLNSATKQVLVENGMRPSTRRGNKELNFLLNRLAHESYPSLAAVAETGRALGQQILAVSQQRQRTVLDAGVVRQLAAGFKPETAMDVAPSATTAPPALDVAEPAPAPVSSPEAAPVITPAAAEDIEGTDQANEAPAEPEVSAVSKADLADQPVVEVVIESPIAADNDVAATVPAPAAAAADLTAEEDAVAAAESIAEDAEEETAAAEADLAAEEEAVTAAEPVAEDAEEETAATETAAAPAVDADTDAAGSAAPE